MATLHILRVGEGHKGDETTGCYIYTVYILSRLGTLKFFFVFKV